MNKHIIVIGGGVAGLTNAAVLAQNGYQVTLLEKNDTTGGRCRQFEHEGFVFDMGPSWYWMPDVFEDFYQRFDYTTSDLYELHRLDPSYKVFFRDEIVNIPADMEALEALFEKWEPGATKGLRQFLKEAQKKYEVSMKDFVYKPSLSFTEFINWDVVKHVPTLDIFKNFLQHTRKYFSHPKILQLLEFPILFLGATAKTTPSLYSMMNYADMRLGTWYPMGGMYRITEAMTRIATKAGVTIKVNETVISVSTQNGAITGVATENGNFQADGVVACTDYHHFDQHILKPEHQNYSKKFWDKQKMAPSSLLFYLGVNKRVSGLEHHNLFFDGDFEKHTKEIYDTCEWPSDPLFYVCCPSKTDDSVAPEGRENLFILMPLAPGIEDSESLRTQYFDLIIQRMEARIQDSFRENIVYKRSYCVSDFVKDYNAFKGNAYGLANTLLQTAFLKPKMKNKKLNNLYFAGQLTVPGPGLPPSVISGQIAADLVTREIN